MGLADSAEFATAFRPATPKVAWVARSVGYRTSAGVDVGADRIDLSGITLLAIEAIRGLGGADTIIGSASDDSIAASRNCAGLTPASSKPHPAARSATMRGVMRATTEIRL